MDLTDEDTEFTREMNTGELTKKDLLTCNERELRTRCSNSERLLKHAYQIIKKLEKENAELKAKIEADRKSYLASRDIDEEFE